MKFGVVVFPGSNRDHDAWYAVSKILGQECEIIWHDATNLGNVDALILPGGFSYGDYLRCGAIAKFSPVMQSIRKFAAEGGLVLGICNGFQILVESGLLPGALVRNRGLEVHLQARAAARGNHQFPVYLGSQERAAPGGPDCARRRLLHRGRTNARSTGSRRPRDVAVSRESEWLHARHRGHLE